MGRSFEREKIVLKYQKTFTIQKNISNYSKYFSEINVINERRGREPACTLSCETNQQKGYKFREEYLPRTLQYPMRHCDCNFEHITFSTFYDHDDFFVLFGFQVITDLKQHLSFGTLLYNVLFLDRHNADVIFSASSSAHAQRNLF